MKWVARVGGGLILGSLLVLAGFLAGQRVITSADPEPTNDNPALFEVEERTVGRTVTLGGEAQWQPQREIVSRRGGIITSLPDELDEVEEGTVVATIDLEPIVLARGSIPAFRDLGRSARGADVVQLQEFLARGGYADFAADGVFGASTEASVKRWQEAIGATPSGTVALGDLLWVPSLPATFRFHMDVDIGTMVSTGDPLVEQVASTPTITLKTSEDQVNLLPVAPDVIVSYDDLQWRGTLGEGKVTDSGVEFPVIGTSGRPVCADQCDAVPKTGVHTVSIEVVIVASTTGPAVPQVALSSDPSGATSVQLANGDTAQVEVLAMVDGIAVVEGVDVGQQVVLP